MTELRADLARLWPTLDGRFWVVALFGSVAGLLILGIPTAVIPNPLFVRMTPTEPASLLTWIASAPLIGLILASYVVRSGRSGDRHHGAGELPTSAAGIGAFLAIGCPICNKLVVGLLGVSGALEAFAPVQPLIGGASVALLAGTVFWRLRLRARGCDRCVAATSEGVVAS